MLNVKSKNTVFSLLALSSVLPVHAEQLEEFELFKITITGDEQERQRTPGSVHKVDEQELQQWKYDDIHRIMESVPGVYVRQEDGYGLRPNIGMRGSGSDRSKKIALMEDGILLAPAPYSAPAAYYFPLMAHMQAIEVFKGPSAINYGPNTVGGAINFVTRDIPGSIENEEDKHGAFDLTLGSFGFFKAHGFIGDSQPHYGWMIEGINLQSDGFKELDNGGDTGFDKNSIMLKYRLNTDRSADVYHQFDFKLGYADETSNETYLGLTDDDFQANPYRRYASSQNDVMDWDQLFFSANHFFDSGEDYSINTTLYRREFSRVWDKLNGFADGAPDINDILADPTSPVNSIYYDVLTGNEDSLLPSQTLILGANARDFISQGIQVQLETDWQLANQLHEISVSLRYHEDEIERNHTERRYLMQGGQLVSDGQPAYFTTRNTASAQALSFHALDKITIENLSLFAGLRMESIDTDFIDRNTGESIQRDDNIIIPGIGASYQLESNWTLLAGVHKGFVPVPPGSDADVSPEESINYEFGARFNSAKLNGELIGFFNDYSNLTGSCTFSSGCATDQLDLGFNAGEVDVWGLEAVLSTQLAKTIQGHHFNFPISFNYTYTQSEFQNSFTSPRPDLSDVSSGDELPYLPEHQYALKLGVSQHAWEAAIAFKYVSSMRTTAGTGTIEETNKIEAQSVVDLSFRYQVTDDQQVYLTVDNVFDEETIVARRPYGARSGKPQTLHVGYKIDF